MRLKIASFLLPRSCDFNFASRVTLKGMGDFSLEQSEVQTVCMTNSMNSDLGFTNLIMCVDHIVAFHYFTKTA